MTGKYRGRVPFATHSAVAPGRTWTGTFPHHLFSLTLSGRATYQLATGTAEITPGAVLHFAPGAWQNWAADEHVGWEVYYLIIDLPSRLEHLVPLTTLDHGISRTRLKQADAMRAAAVFGEMTEGRLTATSVAEELMINRLEYVLLLIKARHPATGLDPRVEAAKEFLHRNLEAPIVLDDVAAEVGLSKARLCFLFQEALGVGAMQYLERLRLEHAAQLLSLTTEDLNGIAQRLCYNDRGYFSKRFKKRWGVTPRQYRRGLQGASAQA